MFNLLGLDSSKAVEILNDNNIKYSVFKISSDKYKEKCDSEIVVKVTVNENNEYKLLVGSFKTKL